MEAIQDPDAKHARNVAKRKARKDRIKWIHDGLEADQSREQTNMWKIIRNQQRGFQGKKTHLIVEGKSVPWSQTHAAFRTHLEQKQWKKATAREGDLEFLSARRELRAQSTDHNAFTLEELQSALNKLKTKKAPGPDEVGNELFLLLDDDNTLKLLEFYSKIWESGSIPSTWKEAIVVLLYKGKGLDTDPANYRPISLLNSIYKVFASMLQARLSSIHETLMRNTQFGFRAGKGTIHP